MSVTARHIPQRKCVTCRSKRPKAELLRVVRYNGGFSVDRTGKAEGRGAYICRNAECVRAALKTRRLDKAFRSRLPSDVYDVLEKLSLNLEV